MEFDVLIPDDREVQSVVLDGVEAAEVTRHKQPGFPYTVRTYACDRPPTTVAIVFAPFTPS
jgi:hypothetical protein